MKSEFEQKEGDMTIEELKEILIEDIKAIYKKKEIDNRHVSDKKEKIKELWKKIHGNRVPCFHWQFHPDMFYWYDEETDSIECDCGLVIPVALQDEELNERNLRKLIWSMETQIYTDYRKSGWDLGYWGD